MRTDHLPSPLVGLAIADALGMPFETQPATSPALLEWDGSYQASEYHKLKPGQWTDDTMMSRILAESLTSCGGFYPKDVADRYRFWFAQGPTEHRGMGKATKEALGRLHEGRTWWQSGTPGSEGNGTAMRAAPMGFFYREDLGTVREFARIDARITHGSLEAEMGSVAVAIGVALLASEDQYPNRGLIEKVVDWLDDSKVKEGLLRVIGYVAENRPVAEALREIGTKAHVAETVPAAFAALVLSNGGYEEAIHAAIRAGGDTDTTGAITGALAGTFYGFEALPKKLVQGLEDHDKLHITEMKLKKGPRGDVLWKLL